MVKAPTFTRTMILTREVSFFLATEPARTSNIALPTLSPSPIICTKDYMALVDTRAYCMRSLTEWRNDKHHGRGIMTYRAEDGSIAEKFEV